LKAGKSVTDDLVERSVLQGIMGYYVIEEVKCKGAVSKVKKWIAGSPSVGMKWLSARRPEIYREKKENDHMIILHDGLRAMLEEMSERSRLRRAERAELVSQTKLIDREA